MPNCRYCGNNMTTYWDEYPHQYRCINHKYNVIYTEYEEDKSTWTMNCCYNNLYYTIYLINGAMLIWHVTDEYRPIPVLKTIEDKTLTPENLMQKLKTYLIFS